MRRILLLLGLVLSALSLFAQAEVPLVFEKPFKPMSPIVVGQGGSFTANGYGFNAFFTNPAAMAGKGSFTLLSINPWLYSDGPMLQFVQDVANSMPGPGARVSSRSLPGRYVDVTLPPGFVPPAGYPGDAAQFQTDVETLVNDFLVEFVPDAYAGITNVEIPQSWTTVDPSALDSSNLETFMPYVQDLLDLNPQLEAVISRELSNQLATLLPPGFPTSPKIRVGVAAGLGLIVRGFGLGFASILDVSVAGDTIVQTAGEATMTLGLMAGYAHEFKLSDSIGLKVGGLLRPMFRVNALVEATALLNGFATGTFDAASLLDSLYANYGTGIGIDVGAILGIGPFGIGLSVTDLFDTRFNYHSSSFGDLYASVIDTQSLPAGVEVTEARHVIPMDVRVGASFHPNLGKLSFLIDPTIHMEVGNFLTLARKAKMAADAGRPFAVRIGDIAAFGAEVRLLRFLAVRAGYYQGALSAGLGAHLLFLDVNVAAYVVPGTGTDLSSMGEVGVSAELAIRF